MPNAIRHLFVILAIVATVPSSARSDEFTDRLRARKIQIELPTEKATAERDRSVNPNGRTSDEDSGASGRSTTDSRETGGSSNDRSKSALSLAFDATPLVKALAIVFLIVIALVGLFALLRYRADRAITNGERPVVVARGGADAVVPDSDGIDGDLVARLAAAGRFDAAIHALLIDALATIAAAHGRRLRPSATSRELAGALPLENQPRAALGRLVLAVEVTRFGARIANRDDYERCLADHAVAIERTTS